jgi:hypothetical protein
LDIFPDIVGAVSAADLLAASLTGKLVSIQRGREKLTPVQTLGSLALAVTGLGILVPVAIDVQHRLGR